MHPPKKKNNHDQLYAQAMHAIKRGDLVGDQQRISDTGSGRATISAIFPCRRSHRERREAPCR